LTEISLNKVIADTLALLEHQFKVAHIQVQSELNEKLPLIQGNAGRLQQVFLNLFLNAKDAMTGGGVLNVATLNGEFVSVRVSDTGSGIAQENIQRIYDPFFTTKTSPAEGQNRGTVLGFRSPTASFRNTRAISAWRAARAKAPPSPWIFR
jgi:two-component system, NtrC family, sensor kinase